MEREKLKLAVKLIIEDYVQQTVSIKSLVNTDGEAFERLVGGITATIIRMYSPRKQWNLSREFIRNTVRNSLLGIKEPKKIGPMYAMKLGERDDNDAAFYYVYAKDREEAVDTFIHYARYVLEAPSGPLTSYTVILDKLFSEEAIDDARTDIINHFYAQETEVSE
jgi:hypothetical protein